MHLNLTNILKIEDCFLRCALVTSKGEEREALARAFPQCFSEQPHLPSHILSQGIQGEAEGFSLDRVENEFDSWLSGWCEILAENGFFFETDFAIDLGDPIPEELWEQLKNRNLGEEIFVEYKGRRYGVMIRSDLAHRKDTPVLGGVRDQLWILLVPAEYIDLTS